ncbi:alpha/beta hydrolase [Bifidobacterium canis]|uniref:Cinnamoyl ester hydrolase n=1 Tax=Bifidobacterium canis TaxID=2610880 RepID=A0A7K1J5L1_9BIFI|nr:alpha/beta fold hydrolase [Bifidobacterium canis]MUH59745.1 Cinnamoyl ester hydrolase [Bifidobacterium canis]
MATQKHVEDITVVRDGLKLSGRIESPQDAPAGPVVIAMHGFMADLGYEPDSLMQQISDQLVDAGFTCVRFDFNGRGHSDGAFANSDIYNQVEDAIAVLDFVRDRFEPTEISLLGHSQGSVIAGMTAGMFADELHSLVMLSPASSIKDDALRGRVLGVPFDPYRIPNHITLADGKHEVDGKYARIAKTVPIYETAAMFKGPALAIQGEQDTVIDANCARNYGNAMANCSVSLYTNLDHKFNGADRMRAIGEAVAFLSAQHEEM